MSPKTAKLAVAVGVISCGVMWAFLFRSVFALRDALAYAEAAVQGDISGVTAALRRALDIAQIGAPFGLVGYILIFVGVLKGGARAQWIYRSGLAVSASYLLLLPIGTIMGICGIVHFRRRKREYLARDQAAVAVS